MKKTAQELTAARKETGLKIKECCVMSDTPRSTWQSWETTTGNNARRTPGIAFAWLAQYRELCELKEKVKALELLLGANLPNGGPSND